MRIGLIARADCGGLGIQSKEFFDHIPNCKALVIDSSQLMSSEMLKPKLERFPDQKVFVLKPGFGMMGFIPYEMIQEFISDIDILFAMETPYDFLIFRLCRERGVKIILQHNYEFLDYPSRLPEPDLFAAPSSWNYALTPDPKFHLPVPVNLKKFTPQRKPKTFVHIGGRPAIHDRNGTQLFLEALRHVKSEVTAIIHSQQPVPVRFKPGDNVNLIPEFGNKENYQDNYTGGVLVLPRKYGGLSLPMNEALAAEMPIITTDISPNNTWLPQEWLVPAHHAGTLRSKRVVDFYDADVYKLAAKIDEFCNEEFYDTAIEKAKQIKQTISWETLLPLYMETFKKLLAVN